MRSWALTLRMERTSVIICDTSASADSSILAESSSGYGATIIESVSAPSAGKLPRQSLPDLLGDKGHEGMKQAQRLLQHVGKRW